MLDDDARRGRVIRPERLDAFPGGIGIGDVVVRQLLALQLNRGDQRAGSRVEVAVERRALVGVLAVAQVLQLDESAVALRRIFAARGLAFDGQRERRQVVADRRVVVGDAVESRDGQRKPGAALDGSVRLQLGQHAGVLRGVGQHRHVLPVLGRRAHHGRPADVDVFDRVFKRATGLGHRGLERVQVDHQQIDGVDAVLDKRRAVLVQIAPRKQAAVDLRVQRLHTAVEHLGESGVIGHLGDRQAAVGQQLGGASGGQQLNALGDQTSGEFNDAGLVGYGEERVHGGSR